MSYFQYLKSKGSYISNFEILIMRSIVMVFGGSVFGNVIYNGTIGQISGAIFGVLFVIYEEKRRYSKYEES